MRSPGHRFRTRTGHGRMAEPAVHAAGSCLLALIPWTVDLRVASLAALSSAINFKAEASSAQAAMLSRSAYTANFLDCIFCHCGPTTVRPPARLAFTPDWPYRFVTNENRHHFRIGGAFAAGREAGSRRRVFLWAPPYFAE